MYKIAKKTEKKMDFDNRNVLLHQVRRNHYRTA